MVSKPAQPPVRPRSRPAAPQFVDAGSQAPVGWPVLACSPHCGSWNPLKALRDVLLLTREGDSPQGYFDGCQRQEVAGLLTGGGRAPESLRVHGDHGCGGSGSDGDGGAAADGLKAVVATTCKRGTGRSARDTQWPQETGAISSCSTKHRNQEWC